MFALKFDALSRKMKADGITLKKIDTVFESTPQFDALWSIYSESTDPMYQMCTEEDGRTHTFYRIYLPAPEQEDAPVAKVPPGDIDRSPTTPAPVRNTNHA